MNKFRILYFTPDPFLGTRFAIAILTKINEKIQIFQLKIPCKNCIVGGTKALLCLELRLDDIKNLSDFYQLPKHFGTQFKLGDIHFLSDPIAHAKYLSKITCDDL